MDSGFAESILGRHHIGPQDRLVKARTPWTPPAPSQTAGESVPPPLVRGELEGGHCLQRAAGQLRTLAGDCRGALLLETVIAIMVFSLVGVAVLAGLSTAYTSGAKTEVQSVAENLARNQVESIFSGPYREPDQTPYPTMTGVPAGYTVSTSVDFQDPLSPDPEVEQISVTARYEGQEVLTLQTLRGRDDGLQLRYSLSDDRSGSTRLHGETISGTVYVFLDDPELEGDDQVDFYLDGVYRQSENFLHWDFNWTTGINITDPASPWDTTTAANGPHTIKASILLNDGNTVNVTADFTISN
ncbi:MAG TPA: type II secretion system protein [Dehalococcoidia bacterium]|nr:type II secretion system protein [Dehalococcoidia bacterium]